MASSVARLPADDWRDPNRMATAAVFGPRSAAVSFPKNLKVRVRDANGNALSFSPYSPAGDDGGGGGLRKADHSASDAAAAAAAAERRESRILDRWAARQAREMVTTIERQAHEAEISALITQPVSARAATFLRETSPPFSECSGGSSIDLPPTVRASSLIQMWKELEAESGVTPSARAGNGCAASGNATVSASLSEEPSGSSDACDDPEAYGDWDSDQTGTSEPTNASSSLPDSERGRVGDIIRMLSSGSRTQSSETLWSDENEHSAQEHPPVQDRREGSKSLTVSRVRRRQEIDSLLERLEKERRREIDALGECRPVSRYSQRRRLQTLLRFRFMRQEVAVRDQQRPTSIPSELNLLQNRATILLLRQRFDHRDQQELRQAPIAESSSSLRIKRPISSPEQCCYSDLADHDQFTNGNNQFQEEASLRDSESPPPELSSPPSISEEAQEGSESPDAQWEDRSLRESNIDWHRPSNCSSSHSWRGEVLTEEVEEYPQQQVRSSECTWISDPSNPWRGWGVNSQALYRDFFENFTENLEIRELLERRRVSTSLASDFRDRMDRMILTFIARQEQQCFDESYGEVDEEQHVWRPEELLTADQVASSSSLVPLQFQTLHHLDNWQQNSLVNHSSPHLIEMEVRNDLRSDVAQIHHEISELRKLVESCLEWQAQLQQCIKQEVSNAIRQSVKTESTSQSSNWVPTRKGNCCICYEMQVDSLLYRCGHMCTCFNCAHELQWSSGRCPICRALIVDVVRAYSNS